MENIVLTVGGLIKTYTWSDLFFFASVLILILLLVYIVYLLRLDANDLKPNSTVENFDDYQKKNIENRDFDLERIVDNLEANYDPKPIDLSKFEIEQENTAIISYDELLKRTRTEITYDDNYSSGFNDIVVNKIDDTNTSNTREYVDLPKAVMMKYDSEEAFLQALKKLQNNLVR